MKTAHTPIKYDHTTNTLENEQGGVLALVRSGGGLPGHFEQDTRLNGLELAKRWNCHAELLTALESLVSTFDPQRQSLYKFAESEVNKAKAAIERAKQEAI